jgi:hypothetical protein
MEYRSIFSGRPGNGRHLEEYSMDRVLECNEKNVRVSKPTEYQLNRKFKQIVNLHLFIIYF